MVLAGRLNPTEQQEAPLCFGEEFLIEDMLMNLVRNAVEASPSDSDVTVVLDIKCDEVRIDVHNKGVVPEAIRDRFFDKYVSAGKAHGTGLGTYSARLIAKAHGGHIEFTSSENEGTTVTIVLPYPEATAVES